MPDTASITNADAGGCTGVHDIDQCHSIPLGGLNRMWKCQDMWRFCANLHVFNCKVIKQSCGDEIIYEYVTYNHDFTRPQNFNFLDDKACLQQARIVLNGLHIIHLDFPSWSSKQNLIEHV